MTKKRGYRTRVTYFTDCDPKDLSAVRNAIDFAESRKEGLPEGTIVEDFTCAPGRREIPDAPNQPEKHTIERVETPSNGDAGPIPESLRRA